VGRVEILGKSLQRILIAGMGYLGEAVARELLKSGYQVWGLRRNWASHHSLAGLTMIAADLTNPASLLAAGLPDVDVVFYMPAAKQRDPELYRLIYQDGLQNLLAALPARPGQVFYVSSTSVYGQSQGEWVTEDSETQPDSVTGKIIHQAELKFLQMVQPFTSLRFGGIYGPGRERFWQRVAAGEEYLDARDNQFTNRIHRDDGAAACLHLLHVSEPQPIYNLVDQDPAARNQVIGWLCGELGRALPPVREAGAHELRGNKRVSCQRLIASGFKFHYPSFREGYKQLIR